MISVVKSWGFWLSAPGIWKQWKKPRTKVANLRKLGIPTDTNERLAAAGYFSILNYYESLHLCG